MLAYETAQALVPDLLKADGVAVDQLLIGKDLDAVLSQMRTRLDDAVAVKQLLEAAFGDSRKYAQTYVVKKPKAAK